MSENYAHRKAPEDEVAMEEKESANHESSGSSSNTLVLASPTTAGQSICASHFSQESVSDSNLLGITYSGSAYDRFDQWEQRGGSPANSTVIDVGASTRSADTDPADPIDHPANSFTVWTLEDETNLARLGKLIAEELSEWELNGHRTEVCFHSVTDLLEHVDQKTAFQFLHVLTARFNSKNVEAHFHMDPSVHEEKTIQIFSEVFDAVARA